MKINGPLNCKMTDIDIDIIHVVVFVFSESSFQMKGDCSSCWYWWNCVVCPSSIYGFWLPLWCLQTLLTITV